jgi:hypothetical protein
MAGDWAYDELLPIAAAELTILGSAVALYANRRSHCLFPLPELLALPATVTRTVEMIATRLKTARNENFRGAANGASLSLCE